jgi:pimeloyl-ACP methyl ester carboxylesterase
VEAIEEFDVVVGEHRHRVIAAGPESGEVVLLLHGWAEFADSWLEVVYALAEAGYRAVAVDQRGYGPHCRPERAEDYAIDLLVADTLAFADAVGAEKFHLTGRDWGGAVGWVLATRYPERLRSLNVLAAPHPAAIKRAAATDDAQFHDLGYVRYFRRGVGKAEDYLLRNDCAQLRAVYDGRLPPELLRRNLARMAEPGAMTAALNWYRGATNDTYDIPAGRIGVPTLFVFGTDDPWLSRAAAELTVHYIDAPYRFQLMPGASQWMPCEIPDEIIPLLLDHIKQY